MVDLEHELRAVLRERATDPSAGLRDDVDRRANRLMSRHRRTAAVGVLGAVALIAAIGVARARSDHAEEVRTLDSTTSTVPDRPVGRWRSIATSPLTARGRHLMVWTGSEVLVVGGSSDPECLNAGGNGCFDPDSAAPGVREGAAYDPATDSWRRIANAPVPLGVYDASAWVDGVALFATQFSQRLLTYDPDSDRWTEQRPPTRLFTAAGSSAALADHRPA